ncbi:unnamed protein product [Rotaria socialis]|uniref:Uncharacterized protein n=1 Tax=Rotaria socialis TaxID=392032 RepID=A0A821DHX7_9BILA|nr:unnamed protein product [Rotaria socialis]CAF4855010.1 unnamed protein product [Rotaria socialis]
MKNQPEKQNEILFYVGDASIKKTDAPIPIPANSKSRIGIELVGIRIGASLAIIFFKSTAFDLASSNRSDQIEALLFIHAFFQPFSWREKKIFNFTLKIIVLFEIENFKYRSENSSQLIYIQNQTKEPNSKSDFTIRDRNRSSKFEIVIAMKKKLEKAGSKS